MGGGVIVERGSPESLVAHPQSELTASLLAAYRPLSRGPV